jgi:hypothetical protein
MDARCRTGNDRAFSGEIAMKLRLASIAAEIAFTSFISEAERPATPAIGIPSERACLRIGDESLNLFDRPSLPEYGATAESISPSIDGMIQSAPRRPTNSPRTHWGASNHSSNAAVFASCVALGERMANE